MAVLLAIGVTLAIASASGLVLDRIVFGSRPRHEPDQLMAILMFGYVGVGGIVLAAGHLGLLYRTGFELLALASVGVVVAQRGRVARLGRFAATRAWGVARRAPELCAAAAIAFTLAGLSAARGPINPDEIDYKWSTPLLFASRHQFVETKARLSNGVHLEHLLVLPSATFRVLDAARLLQVLAVLLLVVAAVCISRRLGGGGLVAAFATLSCFVVPIHVREIGDDILVAGLLLCVLALLLSPEALGRSRVAAGIAFGAAVATKSYALGLAPVFILLVLLVRPENDHAIQWSRPSRRLLAGFLLPIVFVLVLGIAHTLSITGEPFKEQLPRFGIYRSGSPELATGKAAGRIPSVADALLVPAVPFFVGLRAGEPYGTRVGIFFAVALPAVLIGAGFTRGRVRERIMIPIVVGAASYLTLAPVFIKTRFLLFSWVCIFCAADILVESWRSAWSRRSFTLAWIGVRVGLLVSFADAIRLLYTKLPP